MELLLKRTTRYFLTVIFPHVEKSNTFYFGLDLQHKCLQKEFVFYKKYFLPTTEI